MRPSPLGKAAAATALVVALAACSSDSDSGPEAAPSLDATASVDPAEPEPSEPVSSAPADDAIPTSYPEVGLEFTALPEVEGPALDALATYVEFERGMRQLGRTANTNRLLAETASPAFQPTIDSTLDYLRDGDIRYRGSVTVDVALDGAGASTAVLELCADGTDLQLVTAGRPGPITGPARVPMRVILSNGQGTGWAVDQYESQEGTC